MRIAFFVAVLLGLDAWAIYQTARSRDTGAMFELSGCMIYSNRGRFYNEVLV